MRKLVVIFSIIVLGFVSISYAQTDSLLVYQIIKSASVSIFMESDDGAGWCSGVVIENSPSRSRVLTAKHCVESKSDIYVENQKIAYAMVATKDDLAVLVLNNAIANRVAIHLAKTNVVIGEHVYHLGYPTSGELFSDGNVANITHFNHYATFKSIPGCSGGGVFNDDGQLVGILWGYIPFSIFGNTGLSIFEPISDINLFLANAK